MTTDREVATQLHQELRQRCGRSIALSADLEPLSGGFSSDLFSVTLHDSAGELDGRFVLRLLEPGPRALQEQIILGHVAAARYPTAAPLLCAAADSAFGRPYIIMRRLEGGPAVDLQGLGAVRAFRDAPGLIADAMGRLHELDPQSALADLDARGLGAEQLGVEAMFAEIQVAAHEESLEALEALRGRAPEPSSKVFVHGDLHGLNLWRLPDRTVAVLDWEMATIGPRELDVARSSLMLSLVPGEISHVVHPLLMRFGRRADRSFRAHYTDKHPLDNETLAWYRALHALRLITTVLTRPIGDPVASQWRPIERHLTREVELVTGVRLPTPPSR